MRYLDATATEVEELQRIAEVLENMEEAIETAFSKATRALPGCSRETYALHRYHALTQAVGADVRRLLDGVRKAGGGDVPPPGPRDVEDLLCWCGLQVQERQMGANRIWVRFCPEHRYWYDEPGPEATGARSAGSHARAREEAGDA